MSKILALSTIVGLLAGAVGCSLTEKLDIEVNVRPTLLVEFPDDERIQTLHALVFDPQGVYQGMVQMDKDGEGTKAANGTGKVDTLLWGVPEGDYRVVCYANLDRLELAKLTEGTSTLDELAVMLDSGEEYPDADAVYHSVTTHKVKRGTPACACPTMVPKYYHVELVLQEDEDDTAPVTAYSACLEGVPVKIDGAGTSVGGGAEGCCFMPELATDEASRRRTAEFSMNRFGDNDGVELVLFKNGVRIAWIPILPSECGVDPLDPAEVVLPIVIEIAIDKIFITIMDWNTTIVQNVGVGD